MGQCFASLWKQKRSTTSHSSRSKEYINGSNAFEEEEDAIFSHNGNSSLTSKMETFSRRFQGIFKRGTNKSGKAYLLENNDDESQMELYDLVADPQFFLPATGTATATQSTSASHQRGYQSQQPDLRQVVGLRNTLTCCVLPRQHYGKLDNLEDNMDGGAAFIILNPRNLNGHATIPDPALSRSKWSVNSCEETSEKCNRPPSIDLEWENDADFNAAKAEINNDNNKKKCDLDTCSISTTVPCNKGSRTSSHVSIPGLDWDSQVDNDDLVSLNNVECPDFETEQLITEIELLTSRALQETHQWGTNSPSKKQILEANNNPLNIS